MSVHSRFFARSSTWLEVAPSSRHFTDITNMKPARSSVAYAIYSVHNASFRHDLAIADFTDITNRGSEQRNHFALDLPCPKRNSQDRISNGIRMSSP